MNTPPPQFRSRRNGGPFGTPFGFTSFLREAIVAAEDERSDSIAVRQIPRDACLVIPVREADVGREERQDGAGVAVAPRNERVAAAVAERRFAERAHVDEAEAGLAVLRA